MCVLASLVNIDAKILRKIQTKFKSTLRARNVMAKWISSQECRQFSIHRLIHVI